MAVPLPLVAALSSVFLLGLSPYALLWALGLSLLRRRRAPPAATPLASFAWASAKLAPSERSVEAFEREGFVVLRQVLQRGALELLRAEIAAWCSRPLLLEGSCQLEQARWEVDAARDFLFHSDVGRLASTVLRGRSLRAFADGAFAHRYTLAEPDFFSFRGHVDNSNKVGISGGLHSEASGVNVWVPLQDIDPIAQGGSVLLSSSFPSLPCRVLFGIRETRGPKTYNRTELEAECREADPFGRMAPISFRSGDVVMWHPDMLHSSQPILSPLFTRYAWYARFVDADAELCSYYCTGSASILGQSMPCCRRMALRSGDPIHSPCFPQVHPQVLQHEVEAHFGPEPAPLKGEYQGLPYNPDFTYWAEADMSERCRVALQHRWVQ